jgi:hypothetical protein
MKYMLRHILEKSEEGETSMEDVVVLDDNESRKDNVVEVELPMDDDKEVDRMNPL